MSSSIPNSIEDRETYYAKSTKHLTDNATRLGVSAAKILAMKNKYGDENVPESYVGRKLAWDASSKTKDSKITTNLQTVSDEMAAILINIYDNIPADNWTDDDRLTLNRKTGLPHKPTHPETKIAAICNPAIFIQPNALLNFKVTDAKKPTQLKFPGGADAVELVYAIIESKIRPIPAEMIGKVRKDCFGPNDDPLRMIYPTVKFSLQLDPQYSGFDLKGWLRFINIRHPELAGEWCTAFTQRIL